MKLKSGVFTEREKTKTASLFPPTEGSCVPFRPGHKQALCCWAAGSCNPWVPLATSPRRPAADPSCRCPLLSDSLASFLTVDVSDFVQRKVSDMISTEDVPEVSIYSSNLKHTCGCLYFGVYMQFESFLKKTFLA